MLSENQMPDWKAVADSLRTGLHCAQATLERTKSTYYLFVRNYCTQEGGDAVYRIKCGIEFVNKAYEDKQISKDMLLRLRRIAFRLLQMIENGHITWDRAPLYGKQYGNPENEAFLAEFLDYERREKKHADSIIYRDENLIRQYILYAEKHGFSIPLVDVNSMLSFLSYMKERRPAGLGSTVSAIKHFYQYLIDTGTTSPSILLAIKPWNTPHKKVYGVLSNEELKRLIHAVDPTSDIGKRDKAIIMIAMDCGLRSSDICNLKLENIDWRASSITLTQKKTGKLTSLPFSIPTGNALSDYILNARGHSELPYVFLKKSYYDSPMTSSLLCSRLRKLMEKAGIDRPKSEKISMHTFRRSLGTALIDSGESMEMVAQVLGHADQNATKRYICVSEELLRLCALPMPEVNHQGGAS